MKIKIPAPVTLNEKLFSFQQFILENILDDIQFGKDFKSLELAFEIRSKTLAAKDSIDISPEAHQLLSNVVQHPTHGYQPKFAVHLLPFMRAIVYPDID